MIHTHADGSVTMSANKVWRPGVFENARTARIAQRLDDSEIRILQAAANVRGDSIIIEADIKQRKLP